MGSGTPPVPLTTAGITGVKFMCFPGCGSRRPRRGDPPTARADPAARVPRCPSVAAETRWPSPRCRWQRNHRNGARGLFPAPCRRYRRRRAQAAGRCRRPAVRTGAGRPPVEGVVRLRRRARGVERRCPMRDPRSHGATSARSGRVAPSAADPPALAASLITAGRLADAEASANGCGGRSAASMPASSCASPTRCSAAWGPPGSRRVLE